VGRFLILIAIVMAVVWLMRADRRGEKPQQRSRRADTGAGERMVPCARCGVYLPLGEAIAAEGRYYCSEEHRRSSAG